MELENQPCIQLTEKVEDIGQKRKNSCFKAFFWERLQHFACSVFLETLLHRVQKASIHVNTVIIDQWVDLMRYKIFETEGTSCFVSKFSGYQVSGRRWELIVVVKMSPRLLLPKLVSEKNAIWSFGLFRSPRN